MNVESELRQKNIIIVSHVYGTGPSQKLRDFLKSKVRNLLFIGHPFLECQSLSSFLIRYYRGKIIEQKKAHPMRFPQLLMIVKDIFLTLIWVLFSKEKYDLYFGVDGINALTGLILKKAGRVKKVIFYTIDYIPQRFPNHILNWLYHQIDNLCVKKSDWVWNLSSKMAEEREKKGISAEYRKKQIEVPIGTDLYLNRLPFDEIDRYTIAFMGHLRKGQGLNFLINCLPKVVKEIPELQLLLIGGGPLESQLRKKVEQKRLKGKVEITGFVKNMGEINQRLAKCALAVAPYEKDSYTQYTDPGKPKAYLACGLPVIITKVPRVAYEIERERCGFTIETSCQELKKAIVRLLKNEELLKEYRKNAFEFAHKYVWEKVFDKAFRTSFKNA